MTGTFAKYANDFIDHGISIFPCGGDDGKKPSIGWKDCQEDIADYAIIEQWLKKYQNNNIALVTGYVSNITVLDCDDPQKTSEEIQEQYGKSEFIVQTPRGGLHFYYAFNGERNSTNAELKLDVRGQGGYVVAPYSINPKLKKSYKIIKGTLEDLEKLTPLKKTPPPSQIINNSAKIPIGGRNNVLFKMVKNHAFIAQTKEELFNFAQEANETQTEKPLSYTEISNIVNTNWDYKQKGKLIPAGQSYLQIAEKDYFDLANKPDALVLLMLLIKNHKNVRKEFCIIQVEVGKRLKLDPRRIRTAIAFLINKKKIRLVRKSRGKNDGHVYSFF